MSGKPWPKVGDRVVVSTVAEGDRLALVTRVTGLAFWAERPGRCWTLDTLHGPWRFFDPKRDRELETALDIGIDTLRELTRGTVSQRLDQEVAEVLRSGAARLDAWDVPTTATAPLEEIRAELERSRKAMREHGVGLVLSDHQARELGKAADDLGVGSPIPPRAYVSIPVERIEEWHRFAALVSDLMASHFPGCQPGDRNLPRRVAAALLELGYRPRGK